MKEVPPSLAEALASGTTTLAWCWRLTRRDGRRFGFTDHDRDLAFDGTTFEAAAGLAVSELQESAGLAVDNTEITGALTSARLDEEELVRGVWDGARIEAWRVDWTNPEVRMLVKTGRIGEVKRQDRGFTAEVRGLSQDLQRPSGRLFQYTCDADLGDRRCRVDVADPRYSASGVIAAVLGPAEFAATGLDAFESGWLVRGLVEVTSGRGLGFRVEVRRHRLDGVTALLALWQSLPTGIAAGDTIRVIAGCDKAPATCAAKFANIRNFRGFPHIPGNAYVTSVARPGTTVRGSAAR